MKYLLRSFFFVFALLLTSCKEDVAVEELAKPNPSLDGIYSYSLQFDAPYPHYDGENTTRATEAGEWENGDEVYIYLDNPIRAYAKAIYNAISGTWNLTCDKQLVDAESASCVVWYGKKNSGEAIEEKTLCSAFYSKNGSFSINKDIVIINVNLKPYGCRIRFLNEDVSLSGNNVYVTIYNTKFLSGMNLSYTNPFSYWSETSHSQTWYFDKEYNNYSRYHVWELSKDTRSIELQYWSNDYGRGIFSRYLDDNILKEGESGCYTLPTKENPRGWTYMGD